MDGIKIKFVKNKPTEPISEEFDLGEIPNSVLTNTNAWELLVDTYFNSDDFEEIKKLYINLPRNLQQQVRDTVLRGIHVGLDALLLKKLSSGSYLNSQYHISGEVECHFSEKEFEGGLSSKIYEHLRKSVSKQIPEEKAKQIADDIAKTYIKILQLE